MKKVFILLLSLSLGFSVVNAQEAQKSELHQRAESDFEKGNVASARFHFIRAFEDYAKKGDLKSGMECAARGTAMYIKLRKGDSAKDQIDIMENQVTYAADEALKNDLLYNKAVYYYSFGQNAQGNAVFKEMASKLTASKQYDKVDDVYKTLIANARRSGNANMVAQS